MIKEKLKFRKKTIKDYNKLFRQLRDEDIEETSMESENIEEENDEIINKILEKFKKRCFDQKQIPEIFALSASKIESHDDELASKSNCVGIATENQVLVFCETCKENELRVYCQACLSETDHTGHDLIPVSFVGICKSTFDHLFNKSEEISEAVSNLRENPIDFIVKFRDETYALLTAFLKFCSNNPFGDKEEDEDDELEELNSCLSRLFNRIIDTLELASKKRINFKIALGDAMLRKNSKSEKSLIQNLLDCSRKGWKDIIDSSMRILKHVLIFEKVNQELFTATLETLTELESETVTTDSWLILLRVILCDPTAVRKCMNSTDSLFQVLTYVNEICLPEVNIHTLQQHMDEEYEEEDDYFNFFQSVLQFIDIMFSLHDFAVVFAQNEELLDGFLEMFSNFQHIDYLDVKKSGDEQDATEVEMLMVLMNFEGEIFLPVFGNFLKEILKNEKSDEILLKIAKKVKNMLVEFNTSSSNEKRYFSPFVTLQRIFVMVVLSILGFEKSTSKENINFKTTKITEKKLEKLFKKIFKNPKEKEDFFEDCISEIFHIFGFFREVYHKFHARFGDEELQKMHSDYAEKNIILSDCDYTFLQIGLNFTSNRFLMQINKSFSTQGNFPRFFSSPAGKLNELKSKKNFEKLKLLYKDFWQFLVVLYTNEVSISNILIRLAPTELRLLPMEFWKESMHFKPVEKALKDIVFCLRSCNSETLNQRCLNYFDVEIPMFPILRNILDFDEKNKIFRLKKAEEKEVERKLNLCFLRRKETSSALLMQNLSETQIDPDSHIPLKYGNYYDFIGNGLKRVLESCGFIFACKRTGKIFDLFEDKNIILKSSFPLIVLSKFYLDVITEEGIEFKELKKSKKIFLKSHFLRKMGKCEKLNSESAQDKNLMKLVHIVYKDLKKFCFVNTTLPQEMEEIAPEVKEESPKPKKKKKKKSKKMKKIKNRLKDKQKKFLSLFSPETAPEMEEVISKDLERIKSTCSYCLSQISDKEEEFVIPVFMRLVNINEHIKSAKPSYIPLLSSCRHHIHLKCFQKMDLFKDKKKRIWFWQFNCLQCKKISNCYIANREKFVDIDYLKDTFFEQVNNFNRVLGMKEMISKDEVVLDSVKNFSEFLGFLWREISNLTLSNAYYDYFEVYSLILRDIEIGVESGEKVIEVEDERFENRILNKIVQVRKQFDGDWGLLVSQVQAYVLFILKKDFEYQEDFNGFFEDLSLREIKFCAFLALLINQEIVCDLEKDIWVKFSNLGLDDYENREFYLENFFKKEKILEEISLLNQSPDQNKTQQVIDSHSENTIIKLPKSQTKLFNDFLSKKCSECQDWPTEANSEYLLCLICGAGLCRKTCSEGPRNIIKHSINNHSGSCCFISLIKGNVYFVEFPLMLKSSSIYSDDFGFSFDRMRNLQRRKRLFEYSKGDDFYIDEVKEKRMSLMIRRRMLINEISLNSGKIVNLMDKIEEAED